MEADAAIVEVELGAIAVTQRLCTERLDFDIKLELCATEEFANDLALPVQLLFVGKLLIIASATEAEVLTGRRNAIRR